MPAGRPVEYTPERIAEVKKKMQKYTEETALPILAEFCYTNGLVRQYLYEIPELSDDIKKMMLKKEAVLEKGGLSNKFNPTLTIFSLKQLGWKDNHEVKHEGEINIKIDYV